MPPSAKETIAALESLGREDFAGNEFAHSQAISAARNLLYRLQTPTERCWELIFEHQMILGTLQTLKDLGFWEAWAAAGEGEKSLQELLKLTNTDVESNLLERLCRLMAGAKIIDQVGPNLYKPNEFTLFLGTKETLGAMHIQAWTDHYELTARNFAGFLKKVSYQVPRSHSYTCYSDGNPEKLDFWARMAAVPSYQASFGGSMGAWSMNKTKWLDYFDSSTLLDGADLRGPILVDVGGNVGNDIRSFLAKHPDVPSGSLVLQDTPSALEHVKVGEKIQVMPRDFFAPQPVKASRAYFLHAILHDWDEAQSQAILGHLVAVMKKGYSKVLICDVVLPATGASVTQAAMDVGMMAFLSAGERTQETWENLLSNVGLKVAKYWPDPRGFETLIEAELA